MHQNGQCNGQSDNIFSQMPKNEYASQPAWYFRSSDEIHAWFPDTCTSKRGQHQQLKRREKKIRHLITLTNKAHLNFPKRTL